MNEQTRNKAVQPAVEIEARGDPARMEDLFGRHHALVFRTACRITGSYEDAEDVLQTVFLRLVQRPAVLAGVAGIESYLYRAAVNAALDLVRSRRRNQGFPLEATSVGAAVDTRLAPDRLHAAGEIRSWLRQAVAGLSPAAGEAFVLRFFEGKGNGEIAAILGTTPGAVAVTLHRARERLARQFLTDLGGIP